MMLCIPTAPPPLVPTSGTEALLQCPEDVVNTIINDFIGADEQVYNKLEKEAQELRERVSELEGWVRIREDELECDKREFVLMDKMWTEKIQPKLQALEEENERLKQENDTLKQGNAT